MQWQKGEPLHLSELHMAFLQRNYSEQQLGIILGTTKEPPTYKQLKALLAKADDLQDEDTRAILVRRYDDIFLKAFNKFKTRKQSQK